MFPLMVKHLMLRMGTKDEKHLGGERNSKQGVSSVGRESKQC